MSYFVKVFLISYPHLENIISDMDKLVCLKAYSSFGFEGSERISEKILSIIDKKSRLINLKIKLDELFLSLSDEEKWLLEHKYFKRRKYIKKYLSKIEIKFSMRTYFRKQNKLLNKICLELDKRGMTQSWFLNNFNDIDWIFSLYNRLKDDFEKKQTKQFAAV